MELRDLAQSLGGAGQGMTQGGQSGTVLERHAAPGILVIGYPTRVLYADHAASLLIAAHCGWGRRAQITGDAGLQPSHTLFIDALKDVCTTLFRLLAESSGNDKREPIEIRRLIRTQAGRLVIRGFGPRQHICSDRQRVLFVLQHAGVDRELGSAQARGHFAVS